jgi:hypothetical protein
MTHNIETPPHDETPDHLARHTEAVAIPTPPENNNDH